jgi:protein TIF31
LDAGKAALFQGQKDLGLDLLSESLSLHEQVYGVLHPDVARGYSKLSLIYNQLEEMRPTACDLARKAVIISERTLGLDHQETILNYLNWALCEHSNGNTKAALGFITHVLSIWRNLFGEGHPDEITMTVNSFRMRLIQNNVAVMLQSLREHQASLPWFEKSFNLSTKLHGKDSLNAATIAFQYSQALALAQDPIAAVPKMRDAYTVFAKELGAEDRSTKEAEFLLQHFTSSAVNVAKQAKLGKKVLTPNVKVNSTVKAVGPVQDDTGSRGLQNIDDLVKYIGAVDAGGVDSKAKAAQQKKRRGGKR